MPYFLSDKAVLRWLETPSVYHTGTDELYDLDGLSLSFLKDCSSERGCETDDRDFLDYCIREKILTSEKIAVKRPLFAKSPEPSLRYLELQITERCNLRCKHCYIGDGAVKELSSAEIRSTLAEFEEMQGLRVLITGGEPLLHHDFEAINSMLPDFFLRKVLFSNGLLLSRDVLKRLSVDEIQISIDGLEQGHDSLRGKGTFRKALGAVRNAIDAGLEVSVSTMVHAGNLHDFEKMDSLFRHIGIREWTVDVPCATGRLSDYPEFQINPRAGGRLLRYGFGEGLHGGASGFGCGLHLMAVMADGRAAKCTFYADRAAGTIRDGLRMCWSRIQPIHLNDLACDCAHLESCRGGCRYRAELLGNRLGKDFYRCALYGILTQNE